ncbi:MAG: T9SS type A sorting domain-containing protein [Saprospiraceae bacterium]|nr:T9SS type A sorting domain-containing protein [Saprospiraceae bacterium]
MIIRLFLLALIPSLLGAQTWFETGQTADLMVSGVDFNQTGGLIFNHPNGLATDGTHFLVCDRFNNRILVWNSLPTSWNAAPDFVLGQPDFTSNDPGTGKHQLNWVGNASLGANGKLAAADTENDRILLWNSFPSQNGQAADVSLYLPALSNPNAGQFYAWPWGVWTDGVRLVAVATQGSSLLFWNTFPSADNTPPDYVIKHNHFGTPRNISSDGSTYFFVGDHNAKVNGNPGTFFWNSYPTQENQPYDFYRDEWIKGEKLPTGQLVAGGLQSIYIWNQMPTNGSQQPNLILQPDMYKNGDGVDVAYAGNRLYVNNYNGNNVLVFNTLPSSTNQLPDFAVGSSTPGTQTLDSIHYIQNPVLMTDGTRLIVSSDFDRAVYVWDVFPSYSGQPYDHKIKMNNNVQLWAGVVHDSKLITGARNTISVWNQTSQITSQPDQVFVNQIGTALLDDVRGVAMDNQHFYASTRSGKLYVWAGFPANSSQNPIHTLTSSTGQYGHIYADGTYLCAVRQEPPSGVDVYRIADLDAGNLQPFKVISSAQIRLNLTAYAVTFGNSLAIASQGDHRVLLWKELSDWGDPAKVVVLGQGGANSYDAAIGLDRLFMPSTLLPFENQLWVGEFKFSSRILKFSYGATAAPEAEAPAHAVHIFPNPGTGQFAIEAQTLTHGHYSIELFDYTGRLVHTLFEGEQRANEPLKKEFDLNLSSGTYFLKWTGPGIRTIAKLVISK